VTLVGSFSWVSLRHNHSRPVLEARLCSTATVVPITLPAVSPGTHIYTATYSGDTTYLPSTSAAFTLIVPGGPAIDNAQAIPTMCCESPL
jgi:hypothetical protein